MKALPPIFLYALAVVSFVCQANAGAAPEPSSSTNKTPPAIITFAASDGVVSKPFVLTNGCLSQPDRTEVEDGGKAIFSFTITNAGNYIIRGVVTAPDEDSNSFYINVDKQPEDPMMIWDLEVTTGFEERTVNWRGDGDAGNSQFANKRFNLTAGPHKLIIVGREPGAQLKSLSIHPSN